MPRSPKWTDIEWYERIHASWQGQIAGAALGTILEGYCTEQLEKIFGDIYDYPRRPSTYNDDVLFELAFVETDVRTLTQKAIDLIRVCPQSLLLCGQTLHFLA